MTNLFAYITTTALVTMIALLLLSLFIVLVFIQLYIYYKRDAQKSKEKRRLMHNAINLCGLSVMQYDVKEDLLTSNIHQIIPKSGFTLQEFANRIHPDDHHLFRERLDAVFSGKEHSLMLKAWFNTGTPEEPCWRYFEGHVISDANEGGNISTLFFVGSDITNMINETTQNVENGNRYKRLFQTSLTAMSFYSPDGQLLDLNGKMYEVCGITPQNEFFFRNTNLFDMALLKNDFDRKCSEDFSVCQKMDYPELGICRYIEFCITPVYDEHGNHVYYIVTCRDVTKDREIFLEQHRHEEELQHSIEKINQYEKQMHYLLKNNQMYLWWTDFEKKEIIFSQSLRKSEFSRDFQTYVESLVDEDHRTQAKYFLDNYEKMDQEVQMVHHFNNTPVENTPQWYIISGLPIHDEKGRFTGHFGVLRNITYLMESQERLRRETARANDSGRMKSMFLANMTHEIRTPLNAIVGFSDLLQTIDNEEERKEFIRIIRNNCDMLLRLINDILEASNMDRGPQAITLEDVDFAAAFNDICQTLAQRVQNPEVKFLTENPYQSLAVRIDKGRVQQVITNFVTNAVKYTEKGHIKVGYQCENGQLYIYCEDTGAGIPKEKQDMVFDRFVKLNDFVQGTGLGLSICKSIVERCGGRIGVISEGEGHGSTFWMRIPANND